MNWFNSTNAKEIGTLYLVYAVFVGLLLFCLNYFCVLDAILLGLKKLLSLNWNWNSLDITELSFVGFLKIIFFIFFIILNICLLYSEYLDKKYNYKDNSGSHCYMQSGTGAGGRGAVDLKKVASYFIVVAG